MIVSQRFADTRRWAFYEIGAQMCSGDTGAVHGPAPQPAAQPGPEASADAEHQQP